MNSQNKKELSVQTAQELLSQENAKLVSCQDIFTPRVKLVLFLDQTHLLMKQLIKLLLLYLYTDMSLYQEVVAHP
jgi:hypothetical protein